MLSHCYRIQTNSNKITVDKWLCDTDFIICRFILREIFTFADAQLIICYNDIFSNVVSSHYNGLLLYFTSVLIFDLKTYTISVIFINIQCHLIHLLIIPSLCQQWELFAFCAQWRNLAQGCSYARKAQQWKTETNITN